MCTSSDAPMRLPVRLFERFESGKKSGRDSVGSVKSTNSDKGKTSSSAYPTDACVKKLHEIAKLPDQHKEIQDALDDIRVGVMLQ